MRRILCLLLLLCSAWAPAHASFGDCADPAYRARFDPRFSTSEYDCVERLRVPVATGDGTRHIRLIHDLNADWILEPSSMRDFERGVRASVAALGTLGRYSMGDVTILLADDFPPPSATEAFSGIMAMANGAADSSECQIVLYLIGSGASREEAATTVAHEIFHCVQAATYSPGQYGAYRREGGAAWWIEGSAEWFASLALPDDSMYQARVDAFDDLEADVARQTMMFDADGTFSTEPLGGTFSLENDGVRGEGAVANVQSSGRWSSASGQLHLCPTNVTHDIRGRLVTRDGHSVPIPFPSASAPEPRTLAYTCAGDTRTTQVPVPGMGPIRTTFGRSR